MLTTSTAIVRLQNVTNGRAEFVAGILRQKQIALLLWQDEEKKKDEGTTSSVGAGEKGPTGRK